MIIWTRAKVDWEKDSRLIATSKVDVLHMPCVEYVDLTSDIESSSIKEGYDVVIVSSPRAVDFLMKHDYLRNQCDYMSNFLCFGMATAQRLAEDFNFVTQIASVKSSNDFASWLNKRKLYQKYLIIGANNPIIDWQQSITHEGATVDYIPLYKTVEKSDSQIEINKLAERLVICFAAPSSVRAFVQTNAFKHLENKIIDVVAIGKTTEQECRKHFNNTHVCAEPNIESLLNQALLLDKE